MTAFDPKRTFPVAEYASGSHPAIDGSPEYYREKAKAMLKLAETAQTLEDRLEFLSLAEHWGRLAEKIERPNW